ncbi:MAG TPA: Trk system potassium transporter TrkA [Kiritimatiellia bacterium]|jgi:trk system potassium uptake protein TrkA|nr:Trk system potassium transporter TrkA [Kiritimatiellia bacterium]HPW74651.1 Trk system potassium transporter TrkA [Kiritimatiellia bacterium]
MNSVIIGAGHAGRLLASHLCRERHSVVMVDESAEALEQAEASLDVLTVCGSGADPAILEKAGAGRADLFVAVTDRDEINIIACLLAHSEGVPRKIARVGSAQYDPGAVKYNLTKLGIDLLINQKFACAKEICNALLLPGAVESFDLFGGRVLVAGFGIVGGSPILGHTPATLPDQDLVRKLRIIAIRRQGRLVIPRGDTAFLPEDVLYLVGAPDDIRVFSTWMDPVREAFEKVIVAGGGDIGLAIAKNLERIGLHVVLLEQDEERALFCSGELDHTLVLRADALSGSALDETGIVPGTAFVAVTGDDEDNAMNCLMARKKGADFVVTQIARTDYIPIMENLGLVDRIISPYESITNAILHYLRSRDVRAATLLHDLPGELLEIELSPTSRYAGKRVSDIRFPSGSIVAVVQRGDGVLPATGGLCFEAGDRLLIFADPAAVKKIQAMFRK